MIKNLLVAVCVITCGFFQAMSLFGSQCTFGKGTYKKTPLCVMVHPYNGQPSTQFCEDISNDAYYQAVIKALGVNDMTKGKFTFSVQSLDGAYVYGAVDKNKPCALKPQWPFLNEYNGYNTSTNVECWVQVLAEDTPVSNIIFKKSNISFHGSIGNLSISPDTHHLNFSNDGKSRGIIYYVKYCGPVLSNQTRAGLIMLYNDKDLETFNYMRDFQSISWEDFLKGIPLINSIPTLKSLFKLK
ncbi:MAG: hypothetical protein LBT70_03165 [Holosporaceae bacterium]|nr:hypothetical protein [Holosporaceae bacterium]